MRDHGAVADVPAHGATKGLSGEAYGHIGAVVVGVGAASMGMWVVTPLRSTVAVVPPRAMVTVVPSRTAVMV